MTAVDVGLSLGASHREPIRRIVDLLGEAEDFGFDHAWIIDSQMTMKDTYVVQTLAFEHTDTIELGPGVTNPKTRHESVTANVASDLAEISDGRARIGMSNGETSVRPVGMEPASLRELRRSVERVRGLMAGDEVDFENETGAFKEARGTVPIYLAGSGPKMLELAGHFGDGVVLMCAANDEIVEQKLDHIRTGMERAGKDPEDVSVDLWVTVAVDDDDPESAIDDIKPWVASYSMQTRGFRDEYPESLQSYVDEMEQITEEYEMGEHLSLSAKHKNLVSDDLAQTLAVGGSRDHVVERLSNLAELDIDALTLTLLSGGREERLSRLGEDVLPAL